MALAEVRAPIHKNRQTTMGRINGFYSSGSIFKDINLSSKIYEPDGWGYKTLGHFPIPMTKPHGSWLEYDLKDIPSMQFLPAQVGQDFGPTWSTHWFHVTFDAPPATWNGKEIHLRFQSGTEAMIYNTDMEVIQGISPGYREEYIWTKNYNNASPPPLEFYIEMAANMMFGAGAGGDGSIEPPINNRTWRLANVDLRVFNREHFNLLIDIEMLYGMSEHLSNSHIGYQAMFVANEMVTQFSEGNLAKARQMATEFFAEGVGSKAHTLYAMGHCHIDSAWLWPYDETIRKCARSFSAQMGLMDEYPEYKFVVSSAQQYEWVLKYYPKLFERIQAKVTAGQFCPVGGTWVEMDGNIPSGEGFIRQYYYGQKFFKEHFGITCEEFWLPDTFGYSAQIPQMLQHVKIKHFLTQKMSWSLVNKFPNHNFWWEGIDGTQVLVHFPPGDSYNMNGTVNEFLNSQNNSLDKGRCNTGVFLYGYGDGGGGPTRTMIERIKRVQNVDGMPRVKFGESNEFFAELTKESSKFYRWVGELYLELHNGTYTSQARIKWFNRKGEFLFREVELLMAQTYAAKKIIEPEFVDDQREVDICWKDFLLNQFHDVLPGSCIEFVAQDAWVYYERVFGKLFELRTKYHGLLLGPTGGTKVLFNALPWETKSVIFMKPDDGTVPPGPNTQSVSLSAEPFEEQGEGRFRVPNNFTAALVSMSPSGYSTYATLVPQNPASFQPGTGTNFGTFTNGILTLQVTLDNGRPVENLFFDGQNRIPAFNDYLGKGVSPGMLYYYDDVPLFWDAWDVMDYHLETRRLPPNMQITQAPESIGNGPLVTGYKWSATFGEGGSTFTMYTILRADSPMLEYYTHVDWKENRKMLKAEWPIDVLSREATFEIQYGHASRPTHINTSWDMAKFEVCGHKWMDISQADKGVTVITDSKYGWHVRDNHVQLSLLKSPKNPDANADIHKHFIYYAVMPHKGTFQEAGVIQKAYELNVHGSNNVPLLSTGQPSVPSNFVTSSHSAVVVEAVKVSKPLESRLNTLCIRLYEAFGGYADTEVSITGFDITGVNESNGLEDDGGEEIPFANGKFSVKFKPFQIRTFLIKF